MVSHSLTYDDGSSHGSVQVAGEFSGWQPLDMSASDGTSYVIQVADLEAEKKYMYKFVVDGNWLVDSSREITRDESNNENHFFVTDKAPLPLVPGVSVAGEDKVTEIVPDASEEAVPQGESTESTEVPVKSVTETPADSVIPVVGSVGEAPSAFTSDVPTGISTDAPVNDKAIDEPIAGSAEVTGGDLTTETPATDVSTGIPAAAPTVDASTADASTTDTADAPAADTPTADASTADASTADASSKSGVDASIAGAAVAGAAIGAAATAAISASTSTNGQKAPTVPDEVQEPVKTAAKTTDLPNIDTSAVADQKSPKSPSSNASISSLSPRRRRVAELSLPAGIVKADADDKASVVTLHSEEATSKEIGKDISAKAPSDAIAAAPSQAPAQTGSQTPSQTLYRTLDPKITEGGAVTAVSGATAAVGKAATTGSTDAAKSVETTAANAANAAANIASTNSLNGSTADSAIQSTAASAAQIAGSKKPVSAPAPAHPPAESATVSSSATKPAPAVTSAKPADHLTTLRAKPSQATVETTTKKKGLWSRLRSIGKSAS